MSIVNRRRDDFESEWPITSNLWFLGKLDSSRNITGAGRITLAYDLSGNRRHATGSQIYEPTGMNGLPSMVNDTSPVGTGALKFNDGSPLVSSSFSVFWVCRGVLQQTAISGLTGSNIIAATWTSNGNSPLMTNPTSGSVAQDAVKVSARSRYGDQTPRSFAFIYDDATNVRQFYADGVLVADSNEWLAGTTAGDFTLEFWGNTGILLTHHMAINAIYEGKLLDASEVSVLHDHVKNDLGYVTGPPPPASGFTPPVTSGAIYLGDASDPRNIVEGSLIVEIWDESGQERHAVGLQNYEAAGMNGQPTVVDVGPILMKFAGGLGLGAHSTFTTFFVCRGATQMAAWIGNTGDRMNITWTAAGNTPLIQSAGGSTVAQDNTTVADTLAKYGDGTPRSYAFLYDDTTNIRELYVDGVIEATSSQWAVGVASGSFSPFYWGMNGEFPNNRVSFNALYNRLLSPAEILSLHNYVRTTRGYLP